MPQPSALATAGKADTLLPMSKMYAVMIDGQDPVTVWSEQEAVELLHEAVPGDDPDAAWHVFEHEPRPGERSSWGKPIHRGTGRGTLPPLG